MCVGASPCNPTRMGGHDYLSATYHTVNYHAGKLLRASIDAPVYVYRCACIREENQTSYLKKQERYGIGEKPWHKQMYPKT